MKQIHKDTLDSVDGDHTRAWVLADRYLLPGEKTFYDVVARMKTEIPSLFYEGMDTHIASLNFIPGGRILRGLGSQEELLTLFNCLALPNPKDSLLGEDSIMETAVRLASALKQGAGIGFDLSDLRENGKQLYSCAGESSGPVSFMKVYDAIVSVIQQGGSRRGALLMSMHQNHPDVKNFITAKNDVGVINHANLSVRLEYPLNPSVVEAIASCAWQTGEPGVIFLDNMSADFMPQFIDYDKYKFSSVNACSEIPLPAWGVCCLGAVNLANFVNDDGAFEEFEFKKCVRFGVEFLNAVLLTKRYPFPESKEVAVKTRQIGVGIMGLAHALFKKGLRYGSDDALNFIDNLMDIMRRTAVSASSRIGQGYLNPELTYEPIANYCKDTAAWGYGWEQRGVSKYDSALLVNSSLLSGQPTGTTSLLAGASNGIEPLFDLSYQRNDRGKINKIEDPVYARLKNDRPPNVFITAHEIQWEKRIDTQSLLQKYIDNAISSTVNLPKDTSVSAIKELIKYAYKKDLKSVTVFRDGCAREGVLSTSSCDIRGCDG